MNISYNRTGKYSGYKAHPLEVAVDPEVRIAAMTVANYYKSMRDRAMLNGEKLDPDTEIIHDAVDDYENVTAQEMLSVENIITEKNIEILPLLGRVQAIKEQLVQRSKALTEKFKGIDPESEFAMLELLDYVDGVYDYIVDVFRITTQSEDGKGLMCCLLVYLRLLGNKANGIEFEFDTPEGVEKFKEALRNWRALLKKSIALMDSVESFGNMLMRLIRSVIMLASYTILSALIDIYEELTSGAKEWVFNKLGGIGLECCADGLITSLDFSDFGSTEEAANYVNMMLSSLPEIDKNASLYEQVSQAIDLVQHATEDPKTIENELNAKLRKIFESFPVKTVDICDTCIPFYNITKELLSNAFNSLDISIQKVINNVLASIPPLPETKRKNLVLKYLDKLLQLIDKITNLDDIEFSVLFDDCAKTFKGVKDLPETESEKPAEIGGESDIPKAYGHVTSEPYVQPSPIPINTNDLPPALAVDISVPVDLNNFITEGLRSQTGYSSLLSKLSELSGYISDPQLQALIAALLSSESDLSELLKLLGLSEGATMKEIIAAIYELLRSIADRNITEKSRLLRLSDDLNQIIRAM